MSDILLSCKDLSRSQAGKSLFSGLSFGIAEGDRIGLVGPNGSGKSTLVRTLAGLEPPDEGRVTRRRLLRVGHVSQVSDLPPELSVEDAVARSLGDLDLEEHEVVGRTSAWLGRARFGDPGRSVGELSGGWRKRLALTAALAREAELLLLDEPTNHLDVEGILWLEELLVAERLTCLVVSHDRWFLQNTATRMMEIAPTWPTGLFACTGGYADFLEKRDEAREGQVAREATLANKVRREVEWLRRGPKARTTKANARIDEAGRLQEELAGTRARNASDSAGLDFTGSGRKTKRLVQVEKACVDLGGKRVLSAVDLTLGNGRRIGIIGSNGSGKTTLLRLIASELEPVEGSVRHAPKLEVVRFEQDRESLDPAVSLARALAPSGDAVVFRGEQVHVAGWARRFLFRTEQLEQPVSKLSGGEQARVVLARLMLRPADVLLLDEPTNDLDIDTLEVLERSLLEFPGALVLVTHDRFLLDRVADSILAVEEGRVVAYSDLAQWQASRREREKGERTEKTRPTQERERAPKKRKLSYHEMREWKGMEEAILAAEEELEGRRAAAEDEAIVAQPILLQERHAALAVAQEEVDRLYARWAELERKQG